MAHKIGTKHKNSFMCFFFSRAIVLISSVLLYTIDYYNNRKHLGITKQQKHILFVDIYIIVL